VRLIELDEKVNDRLVQLMLSAYSPLLMAGLAALKGVRLNLGILLFFAAVAIVASAWSGYSLWKVLGERRRCRLGVRRGTARWGGSQSDYADWLPRFP
jgi:predicted alpha/beta hydrolase